MKMATARISICFAQIPIKLCFVRLLTFRVLFLPIVTTNEMLPVDLTNISARIPFVLYGTAFKEDQTTGLVTAALRHGFAGIDSAAHTKAYREKLVGEGISEAVESGVCKRESIFVSTSKQYIAT